MNKYIISIILATALMLFSCVNEIEKNQPDAKIYIVNGQINKGTNAVLYNTGIKDTVDVSVYRSGKYGETANVKLGLMSQSELDAHNTANKTQFALLNAGYTVLNSELNFKGGDNQNLEILGVEVDPAVIKAEIEASTKNLVIPMRIESASLEVNTIKGNTFISPIVKPPLVYMGITGLASMNEYKDGEAPRSINVKIPLKVDFKNYWDISCTLGLDQAALDKYNADNESFYTMLPSSAYTLESTVTIKDGTKKVEASLSILDKDIPFGAYILSLKIANVSKFGIDQTLNTYMAGVSTVGPRLDRTGWTATASSDAPGERTPGDDPNGASRPTGIAKHIIDGDAYTFWHSKYSGGNEPLPHNIVVDMGVEKTITQVGIARRMGNQDTKIVEIYISSDNSTWNRIGKCEMETKNDIQIFNVKATKGRYIKLLVTESRRVPFANISEFEAFGF